LNQYGTQSTAVLKPVYTRATLEEIIGKPIVDANVMYSGMQAASLLETFTQLGVLSDLPAARRGELASAVAACPPDALTESKHAPMPAKVFRTPC